MPLVEWEHILIFSTRQGLGCLNEYREVHILCLLVGIVVGEVTVDDCHKNNAATKYIRTLAVNSKVKAQRVRAISP